MRSHTFAFVLALVASIPNALAQSSGVVELITEIESTLPGGFAAIEYRDGLLYAVNDRNEYSLGIWNLSDLSAPHELAQIKVPRDLNPDDLMLVDDYLFVTGSGNAYSTDTTLDVWDISESDNPQIAASYPLFVFGDREYRIEKMLDVRNSQLVVRTETFSLARLDIQDALDIRIIGGYGDDFGRSIMGTIGRFEFTREGGWLDNNDLRYLSFLDSGEVQATRKFNLSGELYDFVVFSDGATGFSISWTSGPMWLSTLDLRDPENPTETHRLDIQDSVTAGFSARMTADEEAELLFVGGETAFAVIDVSAPDAPVVLGEFEGGGDFIHRSGELLFVDGFGNDLLIYRIAR